MRFTARASPILDLAPELFDTILQFLDDPVDYISLEDALSSTSWSPRIRHWFEKFIYTKTEPSAIFFSAARSGNPRLLNRLLSPRYKIDIEQKIDEKDMLRDEICPTVPYSLYTAKGCTALAIIGLRYIRLRTNHKQLLRCFQLLLDAGANINTDFRMEDENLGSIPWWSILHEATRHNEYTFCEFLIKNGANIHGFNSSFIDTPLLIAVENNCLESAVVLVKNGADLEAVTFPGGDTPLSLAIVNEDPEMAEFLIREGAKVPTAEEETQR